LFEGFHASILNARTRLILDIFFFKLPLSHVHTFPPSPPSHNHVASPLSDLSDEQGWKIIHGDVFRFPKYKSPLCAIIGVGAQFLTMGAVIIVMALMGWFNSHRHHSMSTAAIFIYMLSCFVAGYVSNALYVQLEGTVCALGLMNRK
jgi:hypothetical protein